MTSPDLPQKRSSPLKDHDHDQGQSRSQGSGQTKDNSHDKPCTLCSTPRPVLVRCQMDESGRWCFVCPGKCWQRVSGGVEDAKGLESQYPYYRYGGMWKNKHADGPISAKKPKKVKERQKRHAKEREQEARQAESEGRNRETGKVGGSEDDDNDRGEEEPGGSEKDSQNEESDLKNNHTKR